jgi:hypothetical protein
VERAAAAAASAKGGPQRVSLDQNALLLALAGSALYPNLGHRRPAETNFATAAGRKCKLAAQTVACSKGPGSSRQQQALSGPCAGPAPDWVAFGDLTQGRTNFMANDVSAVDPLALLLLSAAVDLEAFEPAPPDPAGAAVRAPYSVLTLDGWVAYRCPPPLAVGLATLRRRLRAAFACHVLGCQRSADGSGPGASAGWLSDDLADAVTTAVAVLAAADGPLAGGGGAGAGGGGGGGSGGFVGQPSWSAADWACPACKAQVFASKQQCFRCGEPKPAPGGALAAAVAAAAAGKGGGGGGKGKGSSGGKGKGKGGRE